MTDSNEIKTDLLPMAEPRPAVNQANIDPHVDKFRSFARKSAEGVIGVGKTIVEAENVLDDAEFRSFCKEVGIEKGSSFYKKLHVIGKNADRFSVIAWCLPDYWTTIYALARLSDEDFDRAIDGKLIQPKLKASEIADFFGSPDSRKRYRKISNHPCEVTLILSDVDKGSLPDIFAMIERWKDEMGLKVIGGENFLN